MAEEIPGDSDLRDSLTLPPDLGRPTRTDDHHVGKTTFDLLESIGKSASVLRGQAEKDPITSGPVLAFLDNLRHEGATRAKFALKGVAQKSPLEGLSTEEVGEYVERVARARADELFKELRESIETYLSEVVRNFGYFYPRQHAVGGELLIDINSLRTHFEVTENPALDPPETEDHPRGIFTKAFLGHLQSLLNAHVRSRIQITKDGAVQDNNSVTAAIDFRPTRQRGENHNHIDGHLRYGFHIDERTISVKNVNYVVVP